ncbi:MAG: hypothetical protein AAF402_12455 [Pseudomonadota bacterium]
MKISEIFRCRHLLCAFVLSLTTLSPYAIAQSETDDEVQSDTTVDSTAADSQRAKILDYLSKERVVIPGVGFENARLGASLDEIRIRLGEPDSVRVTGLLKNTRELLYRPDDNTIIVFGGRDVVDEITIQGVQGSFTRTRKGITFGMKRSRIRRIIFDEPDKIRKNRLEYRSQGINFVFDNDLLTRMVVYSRED